jgi:putative oxidoreductase
MAVGLLLIRLTIGFTMAAHGTQKLFAFAGGHGIRGTAQFLEGIAFRPGRPFALIAGLSELGGGCCSRRAC